MFETTIPAWIIVGYIFLGVLYNFVDTHISDEAMFTDRFNKMMITCTIVCGWPFHLVMWVRYFFVSQLEKYLDKSE